MNKVFITGRGLVTPIGVGLQENEESLRSGRSGIVAVPEFVEHRLDSQVGGMVREDLSSPLLDRRALRFCPPVGLMSVIAAQEAFAEAGIPAEEVRNHRIAVVGGVAGGNYRELYEFANAYVSKGYKSRAVSPYGVPRVMPSSAVSNLSLVFGMRGESYDISAACASSALAVIIGARLIRSGQYDMVLAGGAEQLDWVQAIGFCAVLSTVTVTVLYWRAAGPMCCWNPKKAFRRAESVRSAWSPGSVQTATPSIWSCRMPPLPPL